jgi:GABA(A) receptor-associated protein
MPSFRDEHTLESRKLEAIKILHKYPQRVPIIVEKGKCDLSDITKNKFLVSNDMTMSQFMFTIRKRITLEPSQSLFVLVVCNGVSSLMTGDAQMSTIQDEYKEEDGFVYMVYTSENTFG